MWRTVASKYRVAIIYDSASGPRAYRVAVDLAAKVWDAGSSIRVRRIGTLGTLELPNHPSYPADRLAMLHEVADTPEVHPDDLEWANLTLLVSDRLVD